MQSPLLVILGLYPGSAANTSLGFRGLPRHRLPVSRGCHLRHLENTAMLRSSQNAYQQIGLTDPGSGQASDLYELGGSGSRQSVPGSPPVHA
jgi:hypothetical protein